MRSKEFQTFMIFVQETSYLLTWFLTHLEFLWNTTVFNESYWNFDSKYAKFKYHQTERKQILGKCQCQKFMYIFFVWLNQSSFVKVFMHRKNILDVFSYQKDVTEAIWSCITELTNIQYNMCLYFYTRTWYSLSIRPYSLNKWLHHLQYLLTRQPFDKHIYLIIYL